MYPKVSVCIPTYNHSCFLPETIESVLKQSYGDYELLIIDDCSTDHTRDIIEKYANQDKRIISLINPVNRGMVKNWNLCLQIARGEYIKFLFDDDVFYSDKALEIMVSKLDGSADISLVSTARNIIDQKSCIIDVISEYKHKNGCKGTDIIQDCLIEQKNKIGEPSAVIFRKKHTERGFNERYRQIVDLEMWFHILELGRFVYIDNPLVSFRIHPAQQTRINMEHTDLCIESFQLLQDYGSKPYLQLSAIEREYMRFVPVYSIWKLHKKGKISHKAALDEIKRKYSIHKFIILFPFYRFYKFTKRLKTNIFPKS
jgi:glycosyltransferase involved in cell wall biosynthesis